MNFRKSSDKEDYLAMESHYADRSTPQARKNSFYMNRYREKLLGDNESTRLDIPSMTTNHLSIAIKHLEKLVKVGRKCKLIHVSPSYTDTPMIKDIKLILGREPVKLTVKEVGDIIIMCINMPKHVEISDIMISRTDEADY